jgi:hypothetical protein
MNIFTKLQEAGILSEQDQHDLEVELSNVIAESKAAAKDQVRAEYALRMNSEKAALVEALDKKLTDEITSAIANTQAEQTKLQESIAAYDAAKLQYLTAYSTIREDQTKKFAEVVEGIKQKFDNTLVEEMDELATDKQNLVKSRKAFDSAISESQETYKTKLKEQMTKLRHFVIENLEHETDQLSAQRSKLIEQKRVMAKKFVELKEHQELVMEAKLNSVDRFITESLARELGEFQEDRQALIEARVQFAATANKKLKETQTKFVKDSAAQLNSKISGFLQQEMESLKEDIAIARENELGRKIYEALAGEVKKNYVSDHTEVIQLKQSLAEANQAANEYKVKMISAKKETEQAINKSKMVMESAKREQKITSLTAPLSGERKRIMREMLSSVKTEKLDEAFDKYIVSVIGTPVSNQTNQSKKVTSATVLAESAPKLINTKTVETGNRVVAQPIPTPTEIFEDFELQNLVKLSGIKSK